MVLAFKHSQVVDSQMNSNAGFSKSVTFKLSSSIQSMNFQVCINYECSYNEQSLQDILMNGTWALTKKKKQKKKRKKETNCILLTVLKICFCFSPPLIFIATSSITWVNLFACLVGFVCKHGICFKIIF